MLCCSRIRACRWDCKRTDHNRWRRYSWTRYCRVVTAARGEEDGPEQASAGPKSGVGLKAMWYGAEVLGKLMSLGRGERTDGTTCSTRPLSRQEILDSLKEDYSTNYFVSGRGDMAAYSEDCEFADPFVSFRGTSRFKRNVQNLGGLMQDVKLDVYDWNEGDLQIVTKWRFSCILDLPWKPLLAAAGSTTHVIDGVSSQIVRHVEQWDVEPSKVLLQLLKPAAKVPTTAAEKFFLAVSDRNAWGLWLVVSPFAWQISLPVVLVSLSLKLFSSGDSGLPGVPFEGLFYGLLLAGCLTELVKAARGQ